MMWLLAVSLAHAAPPSLSLGAETLVNDPFLNTTALTLGVGLEPLSWLTVGSRVASSQLLDPRFSDVKPLTSQLAPGYSPDLSRVVWRGSVTATAWPLSLQQGAVHGRVGVTSGVGLVHTQDDLDAIHGQGDPLAEATERQTHPTPVFGLAGELGRGRVGLGVHLEVTPYAEVIQSSVVEDKNTLWAGAALVLRDRPSADIQDGDSMHGVTWWVDDATEAAELTEALADVWPGHGLRVAVGTPTGVGAALYVEGPELVLEDGNTLQQAEATDWWTRAALARSWLRPVAAPVVEATQEPRPWHVAVAAGGHATERGPVLGSVSTGRQVGWVRVGVLAELDTGIRGVQGDLAYTRTVVGGGPEVRLVVHEDERLVVDVGLRAAVRAARDESPLPGVGWSDAGGRVAGGVVAAAATGRVQPLARVELLADTDGQAWSQGLGVQVGARLGGRRQ